MFIKTVKAPKKDIILFLDVFLISKNFPPLFGIYYYVISIPHINQ